MPSNAEDDDNDFASYRRLIMSELRSLREEVGEARREVQELRTSVTILKTKAAMIGGLSGIIAASISSGVLDAVAKAIRGHP